MAVMYQDDGFGKAGLAGVEAALAKRNLKLVAAAPYERNTDKVDDAVKTILAANVHAVIMIAINKPAAAFVKRYREAGGGAQLFSISVVDPAEIVKLAGQKNARGLGISQVVPYPYTPMLPVVREFQGLLKKYAPNAQVETTPTSSSSWAPRCWSRRCGAPAPRPRGRRWSRRSNHCKNHDLGGVTAATPPTDRVGSRYVEVTVIGSDGRLMK